MHLRRPPLLDDLRPAARPRRAFVHVRRAADPSARLADRRRLDRSLLCGGASLAAAKLYGTPVTYDYVTSGVVKGSQTTVLLPDGSLDVRFAFTDRGRGPKLRSLIAFDGRGTIASLHTTGYDYLKVPVDETFVARGGTATWKNASEHETQPSAQPRFYVSMQGSPEELAALARAARKSPAGKLALWPSGEAAISKGSTLLVSQGGRVAHRDVV